MGKRLKEARKEARLTQRELGGERYSPSYICQIEKDKIRPSVKGLEYIGKRLGRPVSYFFADAGLLEEISQKEQKTKTFFILLNLGESYLASQKNELAKKILDEIASLNLSLETPFLRALILRYQGRVKTALLQEDEAEESLLEALSIFKDLEAFEELAKTYFDLAQLHFSKQSHGQARSYLKKAMKVIKTDHIADPALFVDILRCSGVLHNIAGQANQAIKDFEKALDYSNQTSDAEKLAELYLEISLDFKNKGELERAIEYSCKALSILQMLRSQKQTGALLLNLGMIHSERGRLKKATGFFTRSEQIFTALDDVAGRILVLTEQAKIYLSEKKFAPAEEKTKAALVLTEERENEIRKAGHFRS